MSDTAAIPEPLRPFLRAIDALLGFSRDLLERLAGARAHHITTHIPKRLARDVPGAERRMGRAQSWAFALTRVMAGDLYYLPQPGDPPPPPPRPPSATPRWREPGPALDPGFVDDIQNSMIFLRKIRRTFATVPTCAIARGIARRLGIREDSDFWPRELLTITETPAEWADRNYRAPPPEPAADQPPHLPVPPPDIAPTDPPVRPVIRDPPPAPSG